MNLSEVHFRYILPLILSLPILTSAATKVWDGRGTNFFWTNPTNWVDDITPSPGDDLVFPATVRVFNNNDFPPGTMFNSVLITGYEYGLNGNLITLNAGLTNGLYFSLLTIPIRLGAHQTFSVSSNTATAMEFRSPIDLNGFDLTIAGDGNVLISSSVIGAGSLIQRMSRPLYLAGSNAFLGALRVESGTLVVQHSLALGAAAGPTELGPGGILSVQTAGAFDESLVLAGGSRLIGGTWNGPVTLTGPNVEITSSVTFNGPVSGSGGIAFSANGNTLTLNGTNSYTGTNRVTGGTFIVNGEQAASEVYLESPAVLAGLGRLGPIACPSGQIRPGTNSTATMTCSNLNLGESAVLVVEIKGTNAGLNYDQLNVIGTVSLGDAFLTLSNTFVPPPGAQFTLINNDGSDPIIGTFGGLPEGITLASGGVKFRISYFGGDGNDVVLTALAPPAASTGITRFWDGGGANNLWTTPENWIGDVAPVAGDDLEFPGGALQLTNVNDFPPDTTFNFIDLAGSGYRLEGARVALNGGIGTAAADANEVALPLLLNTNQTFFASTRLRILSSIDTAGSSLSFAGEGEIQIAGTISGTGGISKLHSGRLLLLAPNTYLGVTDMLGGELVVSNALALGSPKFGTVIRNNASLTLYTGTGAEPLTLQGRLRSIGDPTNVITAPITFAAQFGVDLQISNTLVLHNIATSGNFNKLGAGTLVLNGTSPASILSPVSNGTVIVNGYLQAGLSLVNGTIGGTGRLYSIIAPDTSAATNRVISPGLDQPAALTVNQFVIGRTIAANVPAKLAIQLNGTRPGIDYDQIRVEEFVNVNNARLEISLGFTPAHGDRFVIIETPSGTQGRFYGLRQGAVFMVGGTQFQISYRGGDGNDVELRVTQGLSLTRTWDGGGNNGYWSNPQNWIDDIAPSPGEILFFPNTLASRTMTTNDFPAGTEFTLIAIDGRFQLHGAPITMDVGLLAYETATIGFPITLLTNLSFICEKDVYATNPIVEFRGGIDLAGHDLLLSNSGPIRVRGQLGPGNLLKAGTGLVELYTNNLHWLTRVLDGELAIYHNDALAASDFPTEVAAPARLTLAGSGMTIAEPLTLAGTLASGGTLVFPWITNRWTGEITLQGPRAAISPTNTTRPFLIAGVIQGPSDLVKLGDGPLLLRADNTYTGATIVSNGVLNVHGRQPQSPIVLRSGTLSGDGVVGDVSATNLLSARVDPGNSPSFSILDTGILACGNLTASSNALLGFTLAGPLVGAQRDQLDVTGTVTLQGCRLDLRALFPAEVPDSFVLIDNDGQDPVVGTFRGIPEGALFVQSNMLFRFSYAGGDGNDVTVTRIHAPASTISFLARQTNTMLLQGVGISNLTYTVQAASNLNAPIFWESIGTSSANRSNIYQFIDTNTPLPMRFYRILSP